MKHQTERTQFLESLTQLFYPTPDLLGRFVCCSQAELPQAYQNLLAHHAHMTVTVEKRHGSSVGVHVLQTRRDQTHYSREILLHRQRDRKVVQYGIVRLTTCRLAQVVQDEIFSERTPLGRVLIEHGVLTQVQLLALWQVSPKPQLANLLEMSMGTYTYGRTALIYCDGEPAIELLEIVAAEENFSND